MRRSVLVALVAGVALAVAHRSEGADTAQMGGSKYGPLTPSSARCMPGQYLAGVDVFWGPQLSNLRPLCGPMLPDGGWEGIPAIGNDVMGAGGGTASAGQGRRDLYCPRDFWISGYKGYTQVNGVNSVTQLTVYCRNVKTGATTSVATPNMPGISELEGAASSCDQNSVATGAFGSSNYGQIIQFALACGTTKPGLFMSRVTSATEKKGGVVAAFAATPTKAPIKPSVLASKQVSAFAAPVTQVFAPPLTADGAHLFHCQIVGGMPCGQAVADAFCKQKNFVSAKTYTTGNEKVRAETLAGQKCTSRECNVFTKIECVK